MKVKCVKPIAKETSTRCWHYVSLHSFLKYHRIFLEQLENLIIRKCTKIVIFNNEKSGELTRSDAVLLLFLNQIGVDVFHFNPTGETIMNRILKQEHLIPITSRS